MARHRKRPPDRPRKLTLWQKGAVVVLAGMITNFVLALQPTPADPSVARGQAVGRNIPTIALILVGAGMMAWDLIRPKDQSLPRGKKK